MLFPMMFFFFKVYSPLPYIDFCPTKPNYIYITKWKHLQLLDLNDSDYKCYKYITTKI